MRRIVVKKKYSPSFSVAGIRLPLEGHHQVVTATIRGKESSRMKNRAESIPSSRTNERMSPWQKLAAIGALSSVALTGCASNVNAEPGPSSSISASEAPSPTATETGPTQAEIEAKIKKLEIPAGLDTTALGGAIIDRLNQWANDGSDASLEQRIDDEVPQGKSLEDIAADIAAKNREVYAVALFGEDYQSHPSVSTYVNQSEGVNRDTVTAYGGTEWNDEVPGSEGYRSCRELLAPYAQLISDEGGVRKYVFDYDFHDNADKNLVEDNTLPKGGKLFVSVETVDGRDIITNITDQPVYAIG